MILSKQAELTRSTLRAWFRMSPSAPKIALTPVLPPPGVPADEPKPLVRPQPNLPKPSGRTFESRELGDAIRRMTRIDTGGHQ